MTEFPEPSSDTRPPNMSELPVSTLEETPIPRIQTPIPKRNRWQRSRCPQRPIGKDHSLGFPIIERGGDSESSSSEVILFRSPIIDVESQVGNMAPSSSSALPSISELQASENPTPKGASTPVFGTNAEEEDPWANCEEPVPGDSNANNSRPIQRNRVQVPITENRFGDAFEMGTTPGIQSNFSST